MAMAVTLIRAEIERMRSCIDSNLNEIEGLKRNVTRLEDLNGEWIKQIEQLSRDHVTLSGSAVPEKITLGSGRKI